MSPTKHHAEWLSLVETSGPFLSLPVLLDTFPQGLPTHDDNANADLRAVYEEWADEMGGLTPNPAIHTLWVKHVFTQLLHIPSDFLASHQAIPTNIHATIPEHHETLRPDYAILPPQSQTPRLLIQQYPPDQGLEKPIADKRWKASPATRMMSLLHATNVRLGVVTNGEHWLLVNAQSGESTGYASWYAHLWLEEKLTLRAFRALLGMARFFGVPDEETLPALLDASAKDQHEVTDQLGYQVRRAVEILIQAIDRADQDQGRKLLGAEVPPDLLYEAALTVMMRLVFLLTAEERGLLLLGDPIYDAHYAVSTLRDPLREMADQFGEEVMARGYDAWSRLLAIFRAVHHGIYHEDLRLPAYGGSLFDPDRFPFLEGRPADTHWQTTPAYPLPINNRTVLYLLESLQLLQVKTAGGGPAHTRRISFRALDVEQIGHVYEGLLDHEARRATEPVLGLAGTKNKEPEIPLAQLAEFAAFATQKTLVGVQISVASKGNLTKLVKFLSQETGRGVSPIRKALLASTDPNTPPHPKLRIACQNDPDLYQQVLPFARLLREDEWGVPVVIRAGSVYVTAGQTRRATGTHYTPRSLTEPIVQHTLEPLVYIGPAEGKPREAWQLRPPAELLNLKICDMAMGSGAFLVQACRYLSERLVEAWETHPVILTEGKNPNAPQQPETSGSRDTVGMLRSEDYAGYSVPSATQHDKGAESLTLAKRSA